MDIKRRESMPQLLKRAPRSLVKEFSFNSLSKDIQCGGSANPRNLNPESPTPVTSWWANESGQIQLK